MPIWVGLAKLLIRTGLAQAVPSIRRFRPTMVAAMPAPVPAPLANSPMISTTRTWSRIWSAETTAMTALRAVTRTASLSRMRAGVL